MISPYLDSQWRGAALIFGANYANALNLGDVEAMNRISRLFVQRGKQVVIANSTSTTLADLRRQHAVLIGGSTNQWSMRSMQFVRYQLVLNITPGANGSRDQDDKSRILWTVDLNVPGNRIQKTYGIVARFNNPLSGQPTVIIDGLGAAGTIGAADFLPPRHISGIS